MSKGKSGAPPLASTLVIVNPGSEGLRIFLAQRSFKASFMPGAYVFPGGRLDPEDRAEAWGHRCLGLEGVLAFAQRAGLAEATARGLMIAALREAFEESGVLFAIDAQGARPQGAGLARALSHRQAVHRGDETFLSVLAGEDLRLDLSALAPWSRWVTPRMERKRFDTWFFIARLPPGQSLYHDEAELIRSRWMGAEQALEAHREGKVSLLPPTFRTLEELRSFSDPGALLEAGWERPLVPIEPAPHFSEEGLTLRLPGDAEYPWPERPPAPGPTRIRLVDGSWVSDEA